jgi:Uma2 family endonuclease
MRTDIKFTYKEYRVLPDTGPRYQLIHGDLVMSPSPNTRHQTIVANVFAALYGFVKAQNLGRTLIAPLDVILDDENVCQPDVLFVAKSRLTILVPEGVRGAPDLCIEVLSPSRRDLDLEIKRVLYARHGVIEYWIVDPENRTVAIFRLQDDATTPLQILRRNSDLLSTPLLPNFSMSVEAVFSE